MNNVKEHKNNAVGFFLLTWKEKAFQGHSSLQNKWRNLQNKWWKINTLSYILYTSRTVTSKQHKDNTPEWPQHSNTMLQCIHKCTCMSVSRWAAAVVLSDVSEGWDMWNSSFESSHFITHTLTSCWRGSSECRGFDVSLSDLCIHVEERERLSYV